MALLRAAVSTAMADVRCCTSPEMAVAMALSRSFASATIAVAMASSRCRAASANADSRAARSTPTAASIRLCRPVASALTAVFMASLRVSLSISTRSSIICLAASLVIPDCKPDTAASIAVCLAAASCSMAATIAALRSSTSPLMAVSSASAILAVMVLLICRMLENNFHPLQRDSSVRHDLIHSACALASSTTSWVFRAASSITRIMPPPDICGGRFCVSASNPCIPAAALSRSSMGFAVSVMDLSLSCLFYG